MILHEDPQLEEAAVDGGLCVCVPFSVWLGSGCREPEITAYNNVWDIAVEYERLYGDDPFSADAVSWITHKVRPIAEEMGYTLDEKESGVVREYRLSEVTPEIKTLAEKARLVYTDKDIEGMICLCLHKPETDGDEDEPCAIVECDGAICAVAGLNDYFTDDTCEIYVETAKDYRGRGFGTAAVAALSEHILSRGETVGYKCGNGNKESAAIAEKIGMTLDGCRLDLVCYSK